MLKLLIILCSLGWVLTETVPPFYFVAVVDGSGCFSIPSVQAQSPDRINIAMEKMAAGRDVPDSGSAAGHAQRDGVVVGEVHFVIEKSGTEKVAGEL